MKRKLLLMILVLTWSTITFAQVIDESFESWPPTGWTLDPSSGDGSWVQDDGSSHGPGSTNIYDGFYAAMFDNYYYSSGTTGSLITPVFDISSETNPTLSFYWWNDDGSSNPATLDIYSTTDGTNWTLIETIDTYGSGATTWVKYSHTLATNVTQIKITATSDYGYKNTFIDKFVIKGVNCPEPTNQQHSVTHNSADLSWTESGTASTWEIEYDTAGFTQGTGTTITVTSDPYTLTGLSSNTSYEWYVRASCGGGDYSEWLGPDQFLTSPQPITIPFSQDFESNSFGNYIQATANSEANIFIDGAAANTGSYGAYMEGKTSTGWSGSSTSTTETQAWNDNVEHISYINMRVDATKATNITLKFDLKQTYSYGSKYSWFRVVVNGTQIGSSYNPSTQDGDAFQTIVMDLSSYAGSAFNLSLQHSGKYNNANGNNGKGDNAYVDNIMLYEETCPVPSNLNYDSLTLHSARLYWESQESEWNLRFGRSGFDTTGVAYITVSSDTFLVVDTLHADTQYDWYLRTSCGGGDYSDWVKGPSFTTYDGKTYDPSPYDGETDVLVSSDTLLWKDIQGKTKYVLNIGTSSGGNDVLADYSLTDSIYIRNANWDYTTTYYWSVNTIYNGTNDTVYGDEWSFTTECGTMTPDYTQDFTSWLPMCWKEATGYLSTPSTLTMGTSGWTQDDFANVTANGKSAKLNIWGNSKKDWLISPAIDLSGGRYQLEFDLALTHYNNTNSDTLGVDDTLAVVISTDGGNTWNLTDTLMVWTYPEYISNTGEHITIDLSSYNTTVKIGFYGSSSVSNADNDIFIDNFKVRTPPSCPEPSGMQANNATESSIDLSWTENGSATSWEIEYGLQGFTQGTGTTVSVNVNPYTLTGLSANTSYDWYIRANCLHGSYSNWVGPENFKTACGELSTFPYTEDFTNWPPDCWETDHTVTGSTNDWIQYNANGVECAKANFWGQSAGNTDIMLTPRFDVSSLSKPSLSFKWSHEYNSNYPNDSLKVEITDDNGSTWHTLWQKGNTGLDSQDGATSSAPGSFVSVEDIDLSSYGDNIQIRFYGISGYGPDLFVDDVVIKEMPTCPKPSNLSQDEITFHSVKLHWTGSASEYNVRIGRAGFDTTGVASFTVASDTFLTVDTLKASTSYEWYIRSSCGGGDYSDWVKSPSSFTTDDGVATGPYPADGATNVLVSADTLSWNKVDGASGYVLNVGTSSGVNDVFDNVWVTDTLFVKNSNWDYSTKYFWTVNTVYTGTNDTIKGTEWNFTTECAAISTFPFTESFETGVPPSCWTSEIVNDPGTDPIWSQESSTQHPTGGSPVDGSSLARFNSYSCPSSASARLITPKLDFSGLSGMVMSFWMYHDDAFSTKPNEGIVIQASTDGTNWTDVKEFVERYNSHGDFWVKHTVDLSAYDNQASVYVGIKAISEYGNDIYVDLVKIHNNAPVTATWTGNNDSNWWDSGNWDTTDIPYPTTSVTIPNGLTNYPTIIANSNCKDLTVLSTSSSGDGSLIASDDLVIKGNATIHRYLSPNRWHDFAVSAKNQTLNCVYFNNSPSVWVTQFNEATNNRTYLTDLTTALPPGVGYEIWVDSEITVSFKDSLQTASVTPTISYSGAGLGYNHLGNPFTSAICLDSGNWNMANVDSTFWIFDGVNKTYKDYNTASKTGSITGGIVPMGQGFFIHANAASPAITIPLAARVHSSQAYYKKGNDRPLITLEASSGSTVDAMKVLFMKGATDEVESKDTKKLFSYTGKTPQIYAVVAGEQLSLNSLPLLEEEDEKVVNIGYQVGKSGQQTIEFTLDNLDDTEIVLEDTFLNIFQDINDNPVYVFNASTDDDPNRFKLHINRSVTGIDQNTDNNDLLVYSFDKYLYILSKGDEVNHSKIMEVYDIMGRQLIRQKLESGKLVKIPVNVPEMYLIVKIISNNRISSHKIFVK